MDSPALRAPPPLIGALGVRNMTREITLLPGEWYGWQMLPGYFGVDYLPYCSPIRLKSVTPKKSGKGILRLEFFNALYAQGVENFKMDIRVLKRASAYLVGEPATKSQSEADRTVIVSVLEMEWLRYFCPILWQKTELSAMGQISRGEIGPSLDRIFEIKQTSSSEER